MTYHTVFGNLPAGNNAASLFDTMFNIAGQQGNIPTTASGTNALTLTPATNYYVPAAYTNGQLASFKAVATSSGSMTLQIGGLALLKLFTAAGVQAASGDVVNGNHYEVQYWSDLDSSAGGFIILNATTTSIANSVQGSFKNLQITNGGSPNTQVVVTADAAVLQNAGGGTARVTSVSVTISTAASGANGIDTGSVANSTWYAVYLIYNSGSSTTAGLLSTSSTAPTLPSGFTYFARYGWVRTNGSGNLLLTLQKGRVAQYTVGTAASTVPNYVVIATATSTTLAAVSVTAQVPTATALEIGVIGVNTGNGVSMAIAPNGNTAAGISLTNPSFGFNIGAATGGQITQRFVLESTSIYYATSSGPISLFATGWTDNIT